MSVPSPHASHAPNAPKAVSILLIDDNHGDAMLFREALEGERTSRSITLHVASSVDQGIALLSGAGTSGVGLQPTIILLDLHMPGKDGKDFLRHRKESADFMRFCVVMLSSSPRQVDVDDCLRLGAEHYHVKPIDWAGYQTLIVFLRQFWD
jgi:two-component system response regulator